MSSAVPPQSKSGSAANRFVKPVVRALADLDHFELAAGVGALELIPENANQYLRTGLLARAALALPPDMSSRHVRLGHWRRLMNRPPVADPQILMMEDPLDDVLIEEIVLPVGAFLMLTGTSAEACWALRQLIDALTSDGPALDRNLVRRSLEMCFAAVIVGDAAYRRAELRRGLNPAGRFRGPVTVPSQAAFDRLQSAVTISETEIADLLRPYRIEPSALRPVTVEGGGVEFTEHEPSSIPKPILHARGHYVLVSPSNLVAAICHAIACEVTVSGYSAQLSARLTRTALLSTHWSLSVLGFGPPRSLKTPTAAHNIEHSLLAFDADKVAHVIAVADDFSDYSDRDMDAEWRPPELPQQLGSLVRDSEVEIFASEATINEILHVLVLQPTWRPAFVSVDQSTPATDPHVFPITSSALYVIAMLETREPMILWYWNRQQEQLAEKGVRVLSWNPLDEYWIYRQNHHSYYLSDDARPTAMLVELSGVLEAKAQFLTDYDPHGARGPDGESIQVVKLVKESGVRTYTPSEFSRPPSALIEGATVRLWIVVSEPDAEDARPHAVAILPMMAYWLDRLWPGVEESIRVPVTDSLLLDLRFTGVDGWSQAIVTEDIDQGALSLKIEGGVAVLEIAPHILSVLARDDNAGERFLIREALTAVFHLAAVETPARMAADIVDEHIPLSRQRAFITVSTGDHPELDVRDLPAYRPVQDAVQATVLDQLGEELTNRGVAVGAIASEQRTKVINEAVEILYQRLRRIVRSSSPDLVPVLVMQHERTIAERSRQHLGLPTRLLDEKSTAAMATRLEKKLPEINTLSLALRFLIEFAVAEPPIGMRPVSIGLLDELVALSAQIVKWGMDSDAIAYGLADSRITMLRSGRLGLSSPEWAEAIRTFLGVNVETELARATFERQPSDVPPELSDFDDAAKAEFGFKFDRIAELLGDVVSMGDPSQPESRAAPREDFEQRLIEAGATKDEINSLFDDFTLGPRSDFLMPPKSFIKSDVFPWRFNRELSYIRRPLLLVQRSGADVVLWGDRHVLDALDYLVGICLSGRLKARTPAMAEAMGRRANLTGRRFSESVARLVTDQSGFLARRHVKKIGKSRITRTNGESLGDIDVLVADLRRHRLWAIEAKKLAAARTAPELRNEIDELIQSAQGKSASALRHTERVEWLRAHIPEVLSWLSLPPGDPRRWRVKPLIVTESDLFSVLVARPSIPAVSYRTFAEAISRNRLDFG